MRASSSAAGDAGDVRRAARIRPKPAIANAMIKAKAQFRSRNVPSEVPGCAPVVVPVAVMGATEAGGWASATCCSTAGVAAGLAAGVCSAACGDGLDADCSTPEGCAPVAVEAEAAAPVCTAFPACVCPTFPVGICPVFAPCGGVRLSPAAVFGFCCAGGVWPACCSAVFGFLFSVAFVVALFAELLAAALLPGAPSFASKTTSRRLNFCSTRGFAPGCMR
ncbi:MAG: hypothetical protein DMF66_19515 [Acidobacteria bacterium]|nr:MAG: hypothetical protein DMF66_19515 [Acidobacteriota bacterium]